MNENCTYKEYEKDPLKPTAFRGGLIPPLGFKIGMMGNLKAIIKSYIGVLIFASLIFIAGGRIVYWQAILYTALSLLGTTLNHLLTPKGSGLSYERESRAKEGIKWDRMLLGGYFFLTIIMFVVAGLDSGRFKWSGEISNSLLVIGVVLMLAGQLLFALARRANIFFFSTLRIETEKEHLVCETGPYKYIRHPGYLGLLISIVGFPLVLNSYWSFLPVLATVFILVLRTYWEDIYLKEKLKGYDKYISRTKWRLIPGVF
jgi:protein-S-isoprenylcysteine O-methyltransferase Ste14